MRWLAVFFLAALSIVGLASSCLAAKRVALVIGNGAYQHTPALSNPPNDAADVAQALKDIGFDVTLKVDIDKRQMDQVVAQFARDGKNAEAVLFYYAGHGMQYEGRNFVMPVDAELQDEVSLRYEMVGVDDIKEAMQISPGVKIMVLDACRDNPLAQKFVRSITVSTRDVPKVQGYARTEKAQGMIVVYATQADDVAQDGKGRNSPFSAAFLKEIKEPGLEVGAMFRRIGGDVYAATEGRQSPELSISMVPEYYLNQTETDQTIWARIRSNASASTLREFLDRFPNSFYAPDARALLDLLDREARDKADKEAAARVASTGDAETRRLKAEETQSEQAAADAAARERAMAEKLAAAESEGTRLSQQLSQLTADEAAAKAGAKAQAERDRAAEADRAEALKTQISRLEQQAADAKAAAEAELQKAAAAKKAVDDNAKTASIAPPPANVGGLTPEQKALVSPIEAELSRIGCYPGGDQDWDAPPVRLGVAEYARYEKLAATPTTPDKTLLDTLKSLGPGVCPVQCSPRETAVNGQCVAKTCAPGETLARDGACLPKAAPRVAARETAPPPEKPAPHKPAPHVAARDSESDPAPHKHHASPGGGGGGGGGHCFSFNGSQYCE